MTEEEARGTEVSEETEAPGGDGDASPGEANGGGGLRETLVSSLMRKEVLIPVAASAASAAVAFAAKKGPDLAKQATEKVKERGSDATDSAMSKVTDSAVSKVTETGKEKAQEALSQASESGGVTGAVAGLAQKALGGGGGGDKGKKTRRLPIQRWTDVAVPVDFAYQRWTEFEEYPKFMHRVLSVQLEEGEDEDNPKVTWNEKIWFSKRQWQAEITDQRENERVSWRTVSGTSHSGRVTFHRLDDRLTRVMVTVDFRPTGIFEKMASGMRFTKRAVQADLARFKAHAEARDEEEAGVETEPEQKKGDEQEEPQAEEQEQPTAEEEPQAEGEQEEQQPEEEREQPTAEQAESEEGEEERDREAERREREARREERRERVSA